MVEKRPSTKHSYCNGFAITCGETDVELFIDRLADQDDRLI